MKLNNFMSLFINISDFLYNLCRVSSFSDFVRKSLLPF